MNIPAFIGIPIRAVLFTLALIAFGIYFVVVVVVFGFAWWWEQVRG